LMFHHDRARGPRSLRHVAGPEAAAGGWIDSDGSEAGFLGSKASSIFLSTRATYPTNRCSTAFGSGTARGDRWRSLAHKVVRDDAGLDLWRDTTTLYTRPLAGHVKEDAADAETTRTSSFRSTRCSRCGHTMAPCMGSER